MGEQGEGAPADQRGRRREVMGENVHQRAGGRGGCGEEGREVWMCGCDFLLKVSGQDGPWLAGSGPGGQGGRRDGPIRSPSSSPPFRNVFFKGGQEGGYEYNHEYIHENIGYRCDTDNKANPIDNRKEIVAGGKCRKGGSI